MGQCRKTRNSRRRLNMTRYANYSFSSKPYATSTTTPSSSSLSLLHVLCSPHLNASYNIAQPSEHTYNSPTTLPFMPQRHCHNMGEHGTPSPATEPDTNNLSTTNNYELTSFLSTNNYKTYQFQTQCILHI